MAPDKIYINEQSDVFGYYSAQKNPPYEEEYIRKDALLEWAKSELGSIAGNFGLAEGGKIVLVMLIDKLNTM